MLLLSNYTIFSAMYKHEQAALPCIAKTRKNPYYNLMKTIQGVKNDQL